MRESKEYQLYKAVATYLRLQYPKVIYHFDLTGVNLSKAQAGMNKAIQHGSGFPDLFIAHPRNGHSGLFIELKAEGTRIHKADGKCTTGHIANQQTVLINLSSRGYVAAFGVGFDQCKEIIDEYLRG
jgi:hypothetical protein